MVALQRTAHRRPESGFHHRLDKQAINPPSREEAATAVVAHSMKPLRDCFFELWAFFDRSRPSWNLAALSLVSADVVSCEMPGVIHVLVLLLLLFARFCWDVFMINPCDFI
jgi:hypothetical protein